MGPPGSPLTCRPLCALQKMLMKQQDRLEEREQDIEEQLYKLESDKRLVEVRGAHPGGVGVLGWAAGLELLGVEEPVVGLGWLRGGDGMGTGRVSAACGSWGRTQGHHGGAKGLSLLLPPRRR